MRMCMLFPVHASLYTSSRQQAIALAKERTVMAAELEQDRKSVPDNRMYKCAVPQEGDFDPYYVEQEKQEAKDRAKLEADRKKEREREKRRKEKEKQKGNQQEPKKIRKKSGKPKKKEADKEQEPKGDDEGKKDKRGQDNRAYEEAKQKSRHLMLVGTFPDVGWITVPAYLVDALLQGTHHKRPMNKSSGWVLVGTSLQQLKAVPADQVDEFLQVVPWKGTVVGLMQ